MIQKKSNPSRLLFLITKTILVLWMVSGGISALLGAEFMVTQIEKLGYPTYFPTLLGIAKLTGAFMLIFPVKKIFKVLTYCGILFEVLMAFVSYLLAGFGKKVFRPSFFWQ